MRRDNIIDRLCFRLAHRYRPVRTESDVTGACSCGWEASYPHWSARTAERDWREHVQAARATRFAASS